MKQLFIFLLVLVGCERWMGTSKSPQEVVQQFVELSGNSKDPSDRKKLASLCEGEMRRAFERMTDEVFDLSYLKGEFKIKNIEVVDSQVSDGKAKVKYKVSVENLKGDSPTLEENSREVELIQKRGQWYLESIRPVGSDQMSFLRGMIF